MKMSEITLSAAKLYLKIDYDMTQRDEEELEAIVSAAKGIVKRHTGLADEELDEYPELTVAALILTADMFDRRQAFVSVSEAKPNETLERILGLHNHNIL